MWFKTESGSTYEVLENIQRIRRVNDSYAKRGDSEWLEYANISPWPIRPGYRVTVVTESLADYGSDDYGTPREEAEEFTTRVTSRCTCTGPGEQVKRERRCQ